MLVALGLLLFFHRDWWLHVALNRALDAIGLTQALRRILNGRRQVERAAEHDRLRRAQLPPHAGHVDPAMLRLVRLEAAQALLELAPSRRPVLPRPAWYQATATCTSPW